jgi:hypothetical protein
MLRIFYDIASLCHDRQLFELLLAQQKLVVCVVFGCERSSRVSQR